MLSSVINNYFVINKKIRSVPIIVVFMPNLISCFEGFTLFNYFKLRFEKILSYLVWLKKALFCNKIYVSYISVSLLVTVVTSPLMLFYSLPLQTLPH